MLNHDELIQIIKTSNLINEAKLTKSIEVVSKDNSSLERYLIEEGLVTEDVLYKTAAKYFNVPFVVLKNRPVLKEVIDIIPETLAFTYQIIAYEMDDRALQIATTDPFNLEMIEFLHKKTNLQIDVNLTTPDDIASMLKQYRHGLEETEFKDFVSKSETEEDVVLIESDKLKNIASDLSVIKLVDTILEYAILQGASDIHIEPEEKRVGVRYRIDGVLRNVMGLPKNIQAGLISRVKILSNLKLDEHRLPQDGRFRVETSRYKMSIRVSIIPVLYGEKITLRLLNETSSLLGLDELGFRKSFLELFHKHIKRPHGLILVTGPTGSGKTTSLYAALHTLNVPGVNIITIEDPIEYKMAHINQSQVNTKLNYTFAVGLRAFLRQDPNIIMVGEIRDTETAEIAINAALTGHLVLSTLHTNSAVGAMPRVLDMGIQPFLAASTISLVIAQRLVRKICTNCSTAYSVNISDALKDMPSLCSDRIMKVLQLEKSHLVDVLSAKDGAVTMWRGSGCVECNNTGYNGRVGIYELLEIKENIASAVLTHASSDELAVIAAQNGMLTMTEDGYLKVLYGITTLEEVLRTTQEHV